MPRKRRTPKDPVSSDASRAQHHKNPQPGSTSGDLIGMNSVAKASEAMDTTGPKNDLKGNGQNNNNRSRFNNNQNNNNSNVKRKMGGGGQRGGSQLNPHQPQQRSGPSGGGGGETSNAANRNQRSQNHLSNETRNERGGAPGDRGDGHQHHYWKNNIPLMGAPTLDLPEKPKDVIKKFTGRCRLFVANLPSNITEDLLKEMFTKFGEVSEVFLGKSNSFAFVKMDTRKNAETARSALDFSVYENRTLRVRLAAHAAAIRVKNLTPMVTNDLLEYAFSYFGEVERAIVIADDRGRSVGEGIVEFARKTAAQNALKRCQQDSFMLTAIPQPVVVEPFEQKDEDEGFADKHINRHQPDFKLEREVGPRFAEPGTFEYEFAIRWKQLGDLEKQKKDRLEIEIQEARSKLMEQMEYAKVEHQTKVLKEKLREMEGQTEKFVQLRSNRLEEDRRRDEERQREEMYLRQREEDILRRSQMQDFGTMRRQENDLRLQASALQELLDRQETTIRQFDGPGGAPASVPDPYGNGNQYEQDFQGGYAGGPGSNLGVSSAIPAQGSPMEMSRYGPQPPNQGAWGPQGPPPRIGGAGPMAYGGPPPQQQQPFGLGGPPFGGPQKRRRF